MGVRGQSRKKFRNFAKILFRKLPKCIILAYFTQNFTNPALIFRAFGRKTNCLKILAKILDENSIKKLTFKLFLKKLMLKIEPSEITSFFYNIFFQFRGWTRFRCPPWLRHWCPFAKPPSPMREVSQAEKLEEKMGEKNEKQ